MRVKRALAIVLALMIGVFALAGCSEGASQSEDYKAIAAQAATRDVYKPHNDVEFNNYNESQKLYDDPNTILWCTAAWSNMSAPLFTVPIRGKLTSSSVSYFPNTEVRNGDTASYNPELRSVDGMYHGSPPPYRYGFTPGGEYVDFTDLETMCTTQPMLFQRQDTKISYAPDPKLAEATRIARERLAAGDPTGAEKAIEEGLK